MSVFIVVVVVSDIDECRENKVKCGPDQVCFNKRGDHECIDTICPTDYERDELTG